MTQDTTHNTRRPNISIDTLKAEIKSINEEIITIQEKQMCLIGAICDIQTIHNLNNEDMII